MHIGGGVRARSTWRARARGRTRGCRDGNFKPGIDFYNSHGNKGQALALRELRLAPTKDIKAVVVLIGANDYGFADIVQTCVTDWLTSPSWWKNYCPDDSTIAAISRRTNINTMTDNVRGGDRARRGRDDGRRLRESAVRHPRPDLFSAAPASSGFRYGETGFTRQTVGGCGVWNRDANWARSTVVNA